MPLPEAQIVQLIEGVFTGQISVFELPRFLYAYTVFELDGSLFSGFGDIPKGEIALQERAVNFRQNIGRFSGAKTFQNVKDLTAFVFDENGQKRAFAEFRKFALEINEKYNTTWLRTEQDSVFSQSQHARRWVKIQEEKNVFPTLEYLTVGDDRVRPSHAALDGLRLPVDHPLWNRIHPQNEWRCRCTVIQHEGFGFTSKRQIEEKTRLIKDDFKKRPDFDYNPGKSDFIFKEKGRGKHDYFKVPREFNADLKRNFGLPSVEDITGTEI